MTNDSLTLFDIETGLVSQIDDLQQAHAQADDLENGHIPGTPEELKQFGYDLREQIKFLESAIQEYVKAEIQKVDSIARLWRYYEFCHEATKQEATRLTKRAKTWEKRLEYLKGVVKYVLGATGKKKVVSPIHTLRLQKNSAKAVQIDLQMQGKIPDKFVRVTLVMPMDLWKDLQGLMSQEDKAQVRFTSEFNLSMIGEALKKDPESVPGAELVGGEHVRCE